MGLNSAAPLLQIKENHSEAWGGRGGDSWGGEGGGLIEDKVVKSGEKEGEMDGVRTKGTNPRIRTPLTTPHS